MRKHNWIVAGILALALTAAPASAMTVETLNYSEKHGVGTARVIDDAGDTWLLRFQDNGIGLGTPGVFDLGIDYVIRVLRLALG